MRWSPLNARGATQPRSGVSSRATEGRLAFECAVDKEPVSHRSPEGSSSTNACACFVHATHCGSASRRLEILFEAYLRSLVLAWFRASAKLLQQVQIVEAEPSLDDLTARHVVNRHPGKLNPLARWGKSKDPASIRLDGAIVAIILS